MNHQMEIEAFALHLIELERNGYVVSGLMCSHSEALEKEKIEPFLVSMCLGSSMTHEIHKIKKAGSFGKSDN